MIELNEIERDGKFIYKGVIYTKLKEIQTYQDNEGHTIFNCKSEDGIYRPFRGDLEVEACKTKLTGTFWNGLEVTNK